MYGKIALCVLVQDWRRKQNSSTGAKGKYIRTYCPVLREFARTTSYQYRTPGYIRPFVGPTGFPDFGRRGWTNQADRLPWRPYGLIRANIISEDARKNRRISENSFGQRSLGFFSFLLPSFFPSSFHGSPFHRAVAHAFSQEKKCLENLRSHHVIIIILTSIAFREIRSLFIYLIRQKYKKFYIVIRSSISKFYWKTKVLKYFIYHNLSFTSDKSFLNVRYIFF